LDGFFVNYSYVLAYWCIFLRDVSILVIILWNLIRINCKHNRSVFRNLKLISQGNRETTMQLMDLSSVILSVVPLQQFNEYLKNHQPQSL
jgi:hypothetical protein